jgi:hypothetical protein
MGTGTKLGYLDGIHRRFIFGWALDTKNPGGCVSVHIKVNGVFVGSAIANRFRSDLVAAGYGDGQHGFEFPVPPGVPRIWSVEATIEGADVPLPPSSDHNSFEESDRPLPPEWSWDNRQFQPSLFVLGAAKCGTTALHHYLGQHPDIFMSDPKEPFYFEAEYDRGTAFYFNRYFSKWAGERIVGEARHRNLYLPYVPERIRRYNPDAKLVAILRNPIERAVSHWWHWYSRAQETLPLRQALDADEERICSGVGFRNAEEIQAYSNNLDPYGQGIYRTYLDSGYYCEQLERYAGAFGKDRLLVILYEDFVSKPREVMASLFAFLDCSDIAEKLVPGQINESAPGMLDHLNEEVKSWLLEHYRPHNQRLESFLGKDLPAWEFPFQGK